MRLGIGGDLVVDPVEASLASPSDLMVIDLLHDGLTRLDDAGRAAACPRRRVGGRTRQHGLPVPPRPARPPSPAAGRSTSEDVIASLERVIARGRHVAGRAVAGGGHGLPGLRRGRGRPRERACGARRPHRPHRASRPRCRCCPRCCRARCSRWSMPEIHRRRPGRARPERRLGGGVEPTTTC